MIKSGKIEERRKCRPIKVNRDKAQKGEKMGTMKHIRHQPKEKSRRLDKNERGRMSLRRLTVSRSENRHGSNTN